MAKLFKIVAFIFILFTFIFSTFNPPNVYAAEEPFDAVYFGSVLCSACQSLENDDKVFETLENQGVIVRKYILEDDKDNTVLFRNYQYTYNVPLRQGMVPILFVGDTYFVGRSAINKAVDDGLVLEISQTIDMLPPIDAPASGFSLAYFVLLGFVDGVNPCAIAMLILFISLLGFTKKKSVLIAVSLTFISAIFISYFLFGTILYQYLSKVQFLS
ncbi:MAG: hypothetical protein RG740_02175, partial [Acholeplasmataceae bacterium]|nr:hypothetical protein [Acholeplasmataceae bacterium]